MRAWPVAVTVSLLGVHAGVGDVVRAAPIRLAPPPIEADERAASPVLDMPARPPDARGGVAFLELTKRMPANERDAAVVAEVLAGNVPASLRTLVAVRLPKRGDVVVFVTADYVAVGSEDDFVRMPVGAPAARAIARGAGCVLPTTEIVDAIFEAAEVRLEPRPLPPGPRMTRNEAILEHHVLIERRRTGRGAGRLVAGHKKDLVATRKLLETPGRVAIYGWHRPGRAPIQPLSLVHEQTYADYSHGLRLVSRRALVNGEWTDVTDAVPETAFDGGPPPVSRASH